MGWLSYFSLDLGLPSPFRSGSSSSTGSGDGVNRKCRLDELLAKVELIEKDCFIDENSAQQRLAKLDEIKDEFRRVKAEIYLDLEACRTLLRQRHAIQRTSGNTVEAIERGVKIQTARKQLETDFRRLADIYSRQCKQRKKLQLTDEELQERYKDLSILKRQIQEWKAASKSAAPSGASFSDSSEQYKTLTELRSERLDADAAAFASGGGRGLGSSSLRSASGGGGAEAAAVETAEDRSCIERWRKRDEEFDKHIWEIGDAIDRIGEVAVTIGEKAVVQNQIAQELQTKTDEAADELQVINNRLKSVMKKQNSTTCCCRVFLVLLLIGLVILFVTVLRNKFFTQLAK